MCIASKIGSVSRKDILNWVCCESENFSCGKWTISRFSFSNGIAFKCYPAYRKICYITWFFSTMFQCYWSRNISLLVCYMQSLMSKLWLKIFIGRYLRIYMKWGSLIPSSRYLKFLTCDDNIKALMNYFLLWCLANKCFWDEP